MTRRMLAVALATLTAFGSLSTGTAHAQPVAPVPVHHYTFASWNMQGSNSNSTTEWKWLVRDNARGVPNLAAAYDVVALQEAGSVNQFKSKPGWACTSLVKSLRLAWKCAWTFSNKTRTVYFVESEDRHQGTPPSNRKNNLAFVVDPAKVTVRAWDYIPPIKGDTYHDGDRGLLKLTLADGLVLYTLHADAEPSGINVGALLKKLRSHTPNKRWVLAGDFNIEPRYTAALLAGGEHLVAPSVPTKTDSTRIVDYLLWSDANATRTFTAAVIAPAAAQPQYTSDHRPVRFTPSGGTTP
ncbi:endonuclease/exonuclease/phosphatase family metal-dependent hydrolase [Actinokineospora baliensis]|uniref:endonuclease/exonuclease/phosphatase family protein n=1 Tax=Actinokineospora baliensis TaxID=547056 RepID=UPI00195E2456|nr:endonuclease/exonuclease/phosphatase family protein [Actinokineospora baliensis]MBM7773956.1 endonuclease/exonuclease/phosphatase family metal-dependent hydrolase [Actinokineospora baliensis]